MENNTVLENSINHKAFKDKISYHISYNKLYIYIDNELEDILDFLETDNEIKDYERAKETILEYFKEILEN